MVHRQQRDLAQVLHAGKQHHDAVDAGRHAAVRRRAILEGAVQAAEAVVHRLLAVRPVISNAFTIVSGMWLRIAPEARFVAIADHVVLVGLDG